MSNNQSLELYKDLYSKYVAARVSVHNYHVNFLKYLGQESYYKLREHLIQLPDLEKQIRYAARNAVKEQKENARQEKRARIEARKAKKNKKNVDISGRTN